MKKVIFAVIALVMMSGCATKVQLECKDSCEYSRDVDGKQAISCTGCTLEVEGREDVELLDISLPELPTRP